MLLGRDARAVSNVNVKRPHTPPSKKNKRGPAVQGTLVVYSGCNVREVNYGRIDHFMSKARCRGWVAIET